MKHLTKRSGRIAFFIIAAAATLAALFYAEEDWRGARAWAAAKRELQARGESFEPRDFYPPPVPDEENLAMAPLFVRIYQYEKDPATGERTFSHSQNWWKNDTNQEVQEKLCRWPESGDSPLEGSAFWTTGHPLDLARVQQYYRSHKDYPQSPDPGNPAQDVMLALSRSKPLLDELLRALDERPRCRFPVDYSHRPASGIALPHYTAISTFTRTLRVRASAELVLGQTADAFRDVEAMFHLRRATAYDPNLISALVDSGDVSALLQPVWAGLEARQWPIEDLDQLQKELLGVNVLAGYQKGIRGGERAVMLGTMTEDLRSFRYARDVARDVPLMGLADSGQSSRWCWRFFPYLPQGWYEQNAAFVSRAEQEYLIGVVDPAKHRVVPARAQDLDGTLTRLPLGPYTFMSKMILPIFGNLVRKFAQIQSAVDQAATACGLEKYYLEHHAYPDALAALVPAYLPVVPTDVIDGSPLRYRLTADGRYQLYSIGWNALDDGGTIVWPANRTWRQANPEKNLSRKATFPVPVADQGDWVWQYTPAEPSGLSVNQSRLESAR